MSYRDYQALMFDLLRKQIAYKKQRRDRHRMKLMISDIREKQATINKFYTDYPYCKQCGGRRPKVHKHDGNKQSTKTSTRSTATNR